MIIVHHNNGFNLRIYDMTFIATRTGQPCQAPLVPSPSPPMLKFLYSSPVPNTLRTGRLNSIDREVANESH
jgi:hypothetical protein